MKADGLTKALPSDKHKVFMKALGLRQIDVDMVEQRLIM